MLFYFANTKNYTLALNDIAMPTHLFYGSSYLHVPVPILSCLETRALSLSQSSGDTSSLVRKLGSAISELRLITLFPAPSIPVPTLSCLETRALSLSQSSGDTPSLVRKLGSAISEL